MMKAENNTRETPHSNNLLRLLVVSALSVTIGIAITTSSTAQDRKDPWEQPPRPSSQDGGKEPSTLPSSPPVAAETSNKPTSQSVVTIVPGELDLTTSDWGKTLIVDIKNTSTL